MLNENHMFYRILIVLAFLLSLWIGPYAFVLYFIILILDKVYKKNREVLDDKKLSRKKVMLHIIFISVILFTNILIFHPRIYASNYAHNHFERNNDRSTLGTQIRDTIEISEIRFSERVNFNTFKYEVSLKQCSYIGYSVKCSDIIMPKTVTVNRHLLLFWYAN